MLLPPLHPTRRFQQVAPRDLEMLATGTTSNEQLHCELNEVFDKVHSMHHPTLHLKLRIFHLYKLLPHNRAMYGHAVRQSSQQLVLSRCVHSLQLWTAESWQEWCERMLPASGTMKPAELPLFKKRQLNAAAVKAWSAALAKRPAAAFGRALLAKPAAHIQSTVRKAVLKKPAIKRTAFTKKTGAMKMRRMTGRSGDRLGGNAGDAT